MYKFTVAPPAKLAGKTRRGFPQNYDKMEILKEGTKKHHNGDSNHHEDRDSLLFTPIGDRSSNPRPVFNTTRRTETLKPVEDVVISPQHEEIIRYVHDSWNMIVAKNPYDASAATAAVTTAATNSNIVANKPALSATAPTYLVEAPSPALRDFEPIDLERWWGRRLFHSITKNA